MSASTGETELAAKGRPNTMVVQCLVLHDLSGEVVEWFMALVLKPLKAQFSQQQVLQ